MIGFKFADILQRVDCYHGMFLNQTEMLMCGQLESLEKEFEKIKVSTVAAMLVQHLLQNRLSYRN